jgi:hypothetical protein
VLLEAQRKCHRRASSSLTWGSMSAQVQEVEVAGLLQSLGPGHVTACRSDEQDRKLLWVTWRRYRAVGDRELSESVDHGGCRLCSLTIAAHMEYDSG